ncbi:MAG TPA: hypothetical protein VGI12_14545 [Vicinamibacterales bacterium]|jgi:hypothetical protein
MNLLRRLKDLADYVAGCTDTPPPGVSIGVASWAWALWWGALGLFVLVFCGQATKFIYVDF